MHGIPEGTPLIPRAVKARARSSRGNRARRLDGFVGGASLPYPRRFPGETFHASRGRGEKPRLERDRERSDRKAASRRRPRSSPPPPSFPGSDRRDGPPPPSGAPPPCSVHQRPQRPWSSRSSFPRSPLLLEVPVPSGDGNGGGSAVNFHLLRPRLAPLLFHLIFFLPSIHSPSMH